MYTSLEKCKKKDREKVQKVLSTEAEPENIVDFSKSTQSLPQYFIPYNATDGATALKGTTISAPDKDPYLARHIHSYLTSISTM